MRSTKQNIALVASGIMLGAAIAGPAASAALTAQQSSQKIFVDGQQVQIEAYSIGGSNYVRLRDVGKAIGFNVSYDPLTNTVQVNTGEAYVPTLLTLGTSITTAVFSNRISASRIAALATAYSLSEKSFKDYQDKVTEMLGEDREKKVHDQIASDYNKAHPVVEQQVEHTGFGEYLVRDLETGRDFRTTQERVYQAFKRISDNLISEQSQSLNDLDAELGLSESQTGYMLGWTTTDWPLEPTFSTMIADNGEPCLTITYRIGTIYDFRDY